MTDEERVRQLAYSIWEAEGRPEGQQQQHWDRALKIAAAEQAAGNDADLEEVGDPIDETPLLEDDLPLEEDELGIQENRLPLEDPDGDPSFDEVPFRDDVAAGQDVPVQDRGHPPQMPTPEATPGSLEPLPEDSATVKRTRRPRRASEPASADDTRKTTTKRKTSTGKASTSKASTSKASTSKASTSKAPDSDKMKAGAAKRSKPTSE
ncbi:DUF2934 domain-containing protein [Halomonas aquamarina]|uniref:DUF2934 domain-containing protein n=1 Tax=Vreelandella aquamarina TaxID=77097 RepID=A0ACC5VPD5_9GAMM|nr:DUF2934 domain-containing protein [Halomonas aquamarina]MBZ5486093.1 DUF2934 domain-containing protein [Halomonas aquamarina]